MKEFLIVIGIFTILVFLSYMLFEYAHNNCVERGGYKTIGGNAFICVDKDGRIVP